MLAFKSWSCTREAVNAPAGRRAAANISFHVCSPCRTLAGEHLSLRCSQHLISGVPVERSLSKSQHDSEDPVVNTRCPPGKELVSARRFKAREAKGREQSSSVWRGRLLTECLCLNSNPPPHLFLHLLLLHQQQRQGRERTLLFHSL